MDGKEATVTALAPTKDEQTMAFLAQFLQIFTGFIAPLVIYVVKRESRFVSFHAMQALIWQIIYFVGFIAVIIAFVVGMFATIAAQPQHPPGSQQLPPAFFFFIPVIWLVGLCGWVLNLVIGIVYGIKANRGEWAAYPVIGRWARRIVGA